MFWKEWKRSMRDMLRRKEFLFAFTVSMAILLSATFVSLLTFFKVDSMYIRPAWSYWGCWGDWFFVSALKGSIDSEAICTEIYVMLLLSLLAAMAYSYAHFDNSRLGICKGLLPREGRGTYYRANAVSVFSSGFLTVGVPLFLQQIILTVAMPFSENRNMGSSLITDDYATKLLKLSGFLKNLQMSHPYFFNFLTALCIAITAGVVALSSYSFSLYFQKSRLMAVLLLPILLWLILPICLDRFAGDQIVSYAWIGADGDYFWWLIETACILFLNIICVEWKIHCVRDELEC